MRKKIIGILAAMVLALGCQGGLTIRAYAASTANTPKIAIAAPAEGQSIAQANVQVTGTAPAGVLVDVDIVDADSNKPFIEHQEFGRLDGSVTSDEDGHWVFTPQTQLAPGQFSVTASYTADNQKFSSNTVKFVVITAGGSSERLSGAAIKGLIVLGAGVLLLVVWLVLHLIRRRRRKVQPPATSSDALPEPLFLKTDAGRAKMQALEEEALTIEQELSRTAQELERANAAVLALSEEIRGQDPAAHKAKKK